MNEQMMKERIQQALNAQLSGVRTSPAERAELYENAVGGRKVKRKLTVSLVFALVLMLVTAAAVAAVLLTHQEIVEQVAVPLAMENDDDGIIQRYYSNEEVARLVRTLNENGITLDETSGIMQALRTGTGCDETFAIDEICRAAFGGSFSSWTLEEQDWNRRLLAEIWIGDTQESELPGEDNLTYEQAEAFAFSALKEKYGKKLDPEDRENYVLERSFSPETKTEDAYWYFTLVPRNVEHGRYQIRFKDREPEESAEMSAEIPDWKRSHTGEEVADIFWNIFGSEARWTQPVWRSLHEKMQKAKLNKEDREYRKYRGYQLTEYPDPAEDEITREEAFRIALEAMKDKQAAAASAVLTEYQGKRTWLIGMITCHEEREEVLGSIDNYVVAIDSKTGTVESVEEGTGRYIPKAAYEKAGEGIVTEEDRILKATETLKKKHPELFDDEEYICQNTYVDQDGIYFTFRTKNARHGDAEAVASKDGKKIRKVKTDNEELTEENLMSRYWSLYGWFGNWDQQVWSQVKKDLDSIEATGSLDMEAIRISRYPEESSVSIGREEAEKLAIKACGGKAASVVSRVLIDAEPNPVWRMRVISYGDNSDDRMIELDAETGEVTATETYLVDYSPDYVYYCLERDRRPLELKALGPAEIAIREVVYAFGGDEGYTLNDELQDPGFYEIREEGLTVHFDSQDESASNYLVELDENGYVLRCEEADNFPPMPTPNPDGTPWYRVPGLDEAFWDKLEAAMAKCGVTADNYNRIESQWIDKYGDWVNWPEDCYIIDFFLGGAEVDLINERYPVFSSEDKPSKQEIIRKGREALYETYEKKWVDQLKFECGRLYENDRNSDTGERFGTRTWVFEIEDGETRNVIGQMWIDEDGNVLSTKVNQDCLSIMEKHKSADQKTE